MGMARGDGLVVAVFGHVMVARCGGLVIARFGHDGGH